MSKSIFSRFNSYFNLFDKLFVYILVMLLCCFLVIVFSFYKSFQMEKRKAFENEAVYTAKVYSNLLLNDLNGLKQILEGISETQTFRDFDKKGFEILDTLGIFLKPRSYVRFIILADGEGKCLYANPNVEIPPDEVNSLFANCRSGRDEFTSVGDAIKFMGSRFVPIYTPVVSGGNAGKGGLFILIDTDLFAKHYLSEAQIRGSGRAWIADSSGNLILSPVYSKTAQKVSLLTEIRISLLDKMKNEGEGVTEYYPSENNRDTMRILAFSKLSPDSGKKWFVCLDATPSEIYGALPRFELLEKYYSLPLIAFMIIALAIIFGYRMFMQYYTKVLKEQLIQSQRMEAVAMFVNGIAHDFNNLVQLMNTISIVLRENDGKATENEIKMIDEISEKSNKLTKQLVNFSRKRGGNGEPVNVNALIHECLVILQHIAARKVVIRIELDAEPPMLKVNSVHIEEILMNLFTNALDAMPAGGFLTVKTSKVSSDEYPNLKKNLRYEKIEVSDTGTGIPKSVVKNIFDPFFSTKGEMGSGLGLSTVVMILKEIDGDISVISEEGKGSTFEIFLPIK